MNPVQPTGLPTFYETDEFTRDWTRLGLDVEDDLMHLQATIAVDPTAAPVVPGTSGLRKLRFSPPSWPGGKRGGLRVCYALFADGGVVLLALVYDKRERKDISPQQKAKAADMIAKFAHELKHPKRRTR